MRCMKFLCRKHHGNIWDYILVGIFIRNYNFIVSLFTFLSGCFFKIDMLVKLGKYLYPLFNMLHSTMCILALKNNMQQQYFIIWMMFIYFHHAMSSNDDLKCAAFLLFGMMIHTCLIIMEKFLLYYNALCNRSPEIMVL